MSRGITDLLAEFDPDLPLDRARTIPSTWYLDRNLYELERQAVFGRSWQMVGRREQVAEIGQFITADVAGEPLLIIRAEDGQLRGFFNVCRHRAAPIMNTPCGQTTKLRCRYHGWTYDLTGSLRGTPEFDGVNDFRKEDNSLLPVTVAEWGLFIWVFLDTAREPIESYLAPLPDWVTMRNGFAKMTWYARKEYDVQCNWKVYVDNYLDGGYHVNTVHPELAGVLDYQEYQTTTHGKTCLQSSPLVPAEGSAGKTRTGDLAAYWWVFPNFMLNLYGGVMDTNLVLPIGPNKCRVVFDFYFSESIDDSLKQESIAVADKVQAEDVGICEEVQRGLASHAFSTGRFSVKRENAGYYFHQLLARQLREAI